MELPRRGIDTKADQVRSHAARNPAAYSKSTPEIVRRPYPPETKPTTVTPIDSLKPALAKSGGNGQRQVDPVSVAAQRHEVTWTCGSPPPRSGFRRRTPATVEQSGRLSRDFGSVRGGPAGRFHRQVFKQAFAILVRESGRTPAQASARRRAHFAGQHRRPGPARRTVDAENAAAFHPTDDVERLQANRSARSGSRLAAGAAIRRDSARRPVAWVAGRPAGRSGGLHGTVRWRDVETGKELRRIEAHEGLVIAAAFLPDRNRCCRPGSITQSSCGTWRPAAREADPTSSAALSTCCGVAGRDVGGRGGDPLAWLIDLAPGRQMPAKRTFRGGGRGGVRPGQPAAGDVRRRRPTAFGTRRRARTFRHLLTMPAVQNCLDSRRQPGSYRLRCWPVAPLDHRQGRRTVTIASHATPIAGTSGVGQPTRYRVGRRDSMLKVWSASVSRSREAERDPGPARLAVTTLNSLLRPAASVSLNGTLAGPVLSGNGRWLDVLNRTDGRLLRLDALTCAPPIVPLHHTGPRSRWPVTQSKSSPSSREEVRGLLRVLDSKTLTERRLIPLPAVPYDVVAGPGGQVFVSGGGSGWTDVIVVDTEPAIVSARWGGVGAVAHRTHSGPLTAYHVDAGCDAGAPEALPLPEPITDKPQAYAAPADARLGGPFVVTPDGRFVLCQMGRYSGSPARGSKTCSRLPMSARSWPRPSTLTSARRTFSARTRLGRFMYPNSRAEPPIAPAWPLMAPPST